MGKRLEKVNQNNGGSIVIRSKKGTVEKSTRDDVSTRSPVMPNNSPDISPMRKLSPSNQAGTFNSFRMGNPSSISVLAKKKNTLIQNKDPPLRLPSGTANQTGANTSRNSEKSIKKVTPIMDPSPLSSNLSKQPLSFEKMNLTYYSKLALKNSSFKITSTNTTINADEVNQASSRKSSLPQTNVNAYYLKLQNSKSSSNNSKSHLMRKANSNQGSIFNTTLRTEEGIKLKSGTTRAPPNLNKSISTSRKKYEEGTLEGSLENSMAVNKESSLISKFNINSVIRKIKDESINRNKDSHYLFGNTQNQQLYKRKGAPTSKKQLLRSVFEK